MRSGLGKAGWGLRMQLEGRRAAEWGEANVGRRKQRAWAGSAGQGGEGAVTPHSSLCYWPPVSLYYGIPLSRQSSSSSSSSPSSSSCCPSWHISCPSSERFVRA